MSNISMLLKAKYVLNLHAQINKTQGLNYCHLIIDLNYYPWGVLQYILYKLKNKEFK